MEEQKEAGEEESEEDCFARLPVFADLVKRFSLFSASARCNIQIGYGGSLNCTCEGCCQWHAFVEGRSPDCKEVQYEVFTLEHVKGLAHYLLMQAAHYKLPLMTVLEVGAGSGRLCYYLSYFLTQASLISKDCVVQLTATDSDKRGLNGPNVSKQDAIEAISKVMPHVVLVSWMPLGVDWTAHIRATPSVLEYILVGEMDSGICGDPWLTWGYTDACDFNSENSFEDSASPTAEPKGTFRNFSNYGSGTPVVMVQIPTHIVPLQPGSGHGNPFEQGLFHKGVGCERSEKSIQCVDGQQELIVIGRVHDSKRPRWHPECLDNSSKSGELCTVIPSPVSLSALMTDDTHQNVRLQRHLDKKDIDASEIPPYAVDGWVRNEIERLSSFQICRTDERWLSHQHSHTVSFRRCPNILQAEK